MRFIHSVFNQNDYPHYLFIKELRPSHALLLYISAQGKLPKNKRSDGTVQGRYWFKVNGNSRAAAAITSAVSTISLTSTCIQNTVEIHHNLTANYN